MSFYIARWIWSYILPSLGGLAIWDISHNNLATIIAIIILFILVMSARPARKRRYGTKV